MNEWNEFLAQRSASFGTGAIAEVLDFGHKPARDEVMAGFVAPLSDLGLLAASGDEAADFLHNQLSNDVKHLDLTQARLAGYCSPKGRLLATMLLWRDEQEIFLQLPRAILPAIQKRLQMFVLRAKVKLADATERQVMLGLGGAHAQSALASYFPALPAQAYSRIAAKLADNGDPQGSLLRVADAFGAPRYQWMMPQETAIALWPSLSAALCPLGNSIWRLAEIEAGVPQIGAATQEKFVPQMINFELIGGVNFKKGCYPGQEIVARSQYLGKLKRRMQLASVDAIECKPGTEVFASGDPEQPCGMIVNAEPDFDGGSTCLVEIKLAALEEQGGGVHLASATGAKLSFAPLPYPLTTERA